MCRLLSNTVLANFDVTVIEHNRVIGTVTGRPKLLFKERFWQLAD